MIIYMYHAFLSWFYMKMTKRYNSLHYQNIYKYSIKRDKANELWEYHNKFLR